jgi:hypothetical protein
VAVALTMLPVVASLGFIALLLIAILPR